MDSVKLRRIADRANARGEAKYGPRDQETRDFDAALIGAIIELNDRLERHGLDPTTTIKEALAQAIAPVIIERRRKQGVPHADALGIVMPMARVIVAKWNGERTPFDSVFR
jgi:hypothetical protein